MIPKERHQAMKFLISGVLFLLAILKIWLYQSNGKAIDSVFFGLVLVALLVFLIPIERLQSLKAGGVEISLDQPQVQGAIATSGLERVENEALRSQLRQLEYQLRVIPGSRILWVEDVPRIVLGERRILRALGVEIAAADSSQAAERVLRADNDFDLIITDVQRPEHRDAGIHLVAKLREDAANNPEVAALPVIFYTSDSKEYVDEQSKPWRKLLPSPEVANSGIELIPKVVRTLAAARLTPITARPKDRSYPGAGANPSP